MCHSSSNNFWFLLVEFAKDSNLQPFHIRIEKLWNIQPFPTMVLQKKYFGECVSYNPLIKHHCYIVVVFYKSGQKNHGNLNILAKGIWGVLDKIVSGEIIYGLLQVRLPNPDSRHLPSPKSPSNLSASDGQIVSKAHLESRQQRSGHPNCCSMLCQNNGTSFKGLQEVTAIPTGRWSHWPCLDKIRSGIQDWPCDC